MTEHPLIPFLRARYDDREKVARAASAAPWSVGGVAEDIGSADVVSPDGAVTSAHAEPCCSIEDAEHIALNDPAYVLADIASKRKMLAECEATIRQGVSVGLAETMLSMLAEPYQDHPDYPKDV